jgi:hypothetical protein
MPVSCRQPWLLRRWGRGGEVAGRWHTSIWQLDREEMTCRDWLFFSTLYTMFNHIYVYKYKSGLWPRVRARALRAPVFINTQNGALRASHPAQKVVNPKIFDMENRGKVG